MKAIKRAALLGVVALFLPFSALAGAWTQNAGDIQAIGNFYYYHTDTFYDINGDDVERLSFQKAEFAPYIEYGYTNNITLGLNPSFQYVVQDFVIGDKENENLADTDVFYRQVIWKDKDSVLSYQPLVKIPGPYNENKSPQLGNGQVDAEMRVLYGQNFEYLGNTHYYDVEMAYRHRFGSPEDEVRIDATLGLRYNPEWQVLLQSFNTYSMDLPNSSSFVPANTADYNLNKLQFSVVDEITDYTSIQLGVFGHVAGKNIGADGGVIFSIWQDF